MVRRALGNTRFILGYLYGSLFRTRYPMEISVLLVESDKHRLVDNFNSSDPSSSRHLLPPPPPTPSSSDTPETETPASLSIPPLAYGTTTSPLPLDNPIHTTLLAPLPKGWHTFRVDVQYVYSGNLPWVSCDSLSFPLASDDGLIDLVIVPPLSRLDSLNAIRGAETASFFTSPHCYYYKCSAYRLTPLAEKGYIAVDGEKVNHAAFQVESHKGLARVLSIEGRWMGKVGMKI